MQKTVSYYDAQGIREEKDELNGDKKENHNVWINFSESTDEDIKDLEKSFH